MDDDELYLTPFGWSAIIAGVVIGILIAKWLFG